MRNRTIHRTATASFLALALSTGGVAALAADVGSTTVKVTDTAVWTPPSPDPSGITYIPAADRLVVADAEVDEIVFGPTEPGGYKGANLYTMSRAGVLTGTGTTKESTTGWSVEPTGLAYNAGTMYVADDDKKSIFAITSAGADGVFGTADDAPATPKGFKTSTFGNTDPEGVAYDTKRNELLLINGQTGARFYRLTSGVNGVFDGVAPAGDDIASEYDLERYGVLDPEGIAYDAVRDTVVVSSDGSQALFELDHNGSLLNTVSIAQMDAQNAADVVIAPSSTGTGRSYYLVDRGLDNNSHPGENDGKVFEIRADLPPITNFPPVANAGVDQMLDLGETATLTGAGVDSDATDALTYSWNVVSGPGTATMATPNASSTTATFSAVGDYVFRLTVRDPKGAFGVDEATIRVFTPGAARNVALPVTSGSDDAQEGGGTSGKFVEVDSADNELGNTGGATPVNVLTGLRFTGLPVPKGSEIVSAKIQFKVDEGSSGPAAFSIVGEAADNAGTYLKVNGNISSRAQTAATVPWAPPTWTAPAQPDGGASGPDQLTPDLKTIVQQIVDRPAWARGNAAAFMVSGTGRRTAEAKDGLTPPVLMLEFKTPTPNGAPVVNAGPDATVVMPSAATLDGTVTDDGKPAPFTTAWSKVSGPGTVSFANASAVDTSATFSAPGTYTLRLTANDTAQTGQDDVVVNVSSAPVANQAPTVDAGPNRTVVMPNAASLDGTVTDDGKPGPFTTAWSKVSGPGTVSFGSASAVDTSATFSAAGTYILRLTANDTALTGQDDVAVTVSAAPVANQAPVVDAGPNRTVRMPNTAALDGTVTDDGKPGPLTTAWSKASGPGTVTFGSVSAVDTTAKFSAAGTYSLRLTANDGALTSSDTMTVTVQPSVQPTLQASASPTSTKVSRVVTITGRLTPALNGQTVRLQRSNGTSYVDTGATRTVTGGSTATVTFSASSSTPGTVRYRLFAPAFGTSLSATSNSVAISYTR